MSEVLEARAETVGQLKNILKGLSDDLYVRAYEGECTCIVIEDITGRSFAHIDTITEHELHLKSIGHGR